MVPPKLRGPRPSLTVSPLSDRPWKPQEKPSLLRLTRHFGRACAKTVWRHQ